MRSPASLGGALLFLRPRAPLRRRNWVKAAVLEAVWLGAGRIQLVVPQGQLRGPHRWRCRSQSREILHRWCARGAIDSGEGDGDGRPPSDRWWNSFRKGRTAP